MCGLTGFLGNGTNSDLAQMVEKLLHRGPDETRTLVLEEQNLYLGHTRLSILDLSGGKQPMSSTCGNYSIVFNGEIYNHLDIRKELESKGRKFQTDHSDTETILNGFAEYGNAIWPKLGGMWAVAIWDKRNKALILSRDHFGQKPLYYYHNSEVFAFSSELMSLSQHSLVNLKIHPLHLARFLLMDYVPAPNSLYQGIHKVMPGEFLVFKDRVVTKKRFWKLNLTIRDTHENEREMLRDLLEKAVQRTLQSDVPLGVFLSGGIDSSMVSSITAKHIDSVDTFSIGFREASFDESAYARLLAKKLKTNHHEKILSIDQAKNIIPSILPKMGEPLGDGSLIPTFLVSQLAASKLKVVLGGDGMDELMAGYDTFKAIAPAKFFNFGIPHFWKWIMDGTLKMCPVSFNNMSFDFKLARFKRVLGESERNWPLLWMSSSMIDEINKLLGTNFNFCDIYADSIELYEKVAPTNPYDWFLHYYSELYLPNNIFKKVDTASMLNSLEVRAPWLDVPLVEFITSLPIDKKFRKGAGKALLKEVAKDYIPSELIKRKKKGFGIPVAQWLLDENCFKFCPTSSLYDTNFRNKILSQHREKRVNKGALLWNLYVFEQCATQ